MGGMTDGLKGLAAALSGKSWIQMVSLLALITGILPITLLDHIAARMSRASKKRRRSYDRRNQSEDERTLSLEAFLRLQHNLHVVDRFIPIQRKRDIKMHDLA